MKYELFAEGADGAETIDLRELGAGRFAVTAFGRSFEVEAQRAHDGSLWLRQGTALTKARVSTAPDGKITASTGARQLTVDVLGARESAQRKLASLSGSQAAGWEVRSPMPGKVVNVLVAAGAEVKAGQGLVVVEAMKMENELRAPRAGVVKEVLVSAGKTVDAGAILLKAE